MREEIESMKYNELKINCNPAHNEILIALLADLGFDMFTENENGLLAYAPVNSNLKNDVIEFMDSLSFEIGEWQLNDLPDENWNSEWEKNFEPVEIDNSIYVHAQFHPQKKGFKHDILIQPKMSFGTGHHATTALVMEEMLNHSFENKTVLDMGCGSGILAILASQLNAKSIDAIDIEEWAVNNAIENATMNKVSNISVYEGDASLAEGKKYDTVLANINRNILLEDMQRYVQSMNGTSLLIVSGFYAEDSNAIDQKAISLKLHPLNMKTKNNWCMMSFEKK